jgi:hypothetical protein
MPEGVSLSQNYQTKSGVGVPGLFFKKNNNWLVSDDDDFSNIIFDKNTIDLGKGRTGDKASVFTVLIDREYWYTDEDNLVRHIRSLQTSDLFDCRTVYLEKSLPTTGERKEIEDPEGHTPGDPEYTPTYEEGPLTYVEKSGTGEQTLTFDMKLDERDSTSIKDRQNQAIADYTTMSYVFKFKDKDNQTFEVSPSNVLKINKGNYSIVRFIVTWSSDMGRLADPQWTERDSVPVELFATASSNFIYKLANINMKFVSQQESGDYLTRVNLL